MYVDSFCHAHTHTLSLSLCVPLPLAVSVEQRVQHKLLGYSNRWENISCYLLLIKLAEIKAKLAQQSIVSMCVVMVQTDSSSTVGRQ
jgi:hypothetical protein